MRVLVYFKSLHFNSIGQTQNTCLANCVTYTHDVYVTTYTGWAKKNETLCFLNNFLLRCAIVKFQKACYREHSGEHFWLFLFFSGTGTTNGSDSKIKIKK